MSDDDEADHEKTQIFLPSGKPMGVPKAAAEPEPAANEGTAVDFDITAGANTSTPAPVDSEAPTQAAPPPMLDARPAEQGTSSRTVILVTLAILSVVAYIFLQ